MLDVVSLDAARLLAPVVEVASTDLVNISAPNLEIAAVSSVRTSAGELFQLEAQDTVTPGPPPKQTVPHRIAAAATVCLNPRG